MGRAKPRYVKIQTLTGLLCKPIICKGCVHGQKYGELCLNAFIIIIIFWADKQAYQKLIFYNFCGLS